MNLPRRGGLVNAAVEVSSLIRQFRENRARLLAVREDLRRRGELDRRFDGVVRPVRTDPVGPRPPRTAGPAVDRRLAGADPVRGGVREGVGEGGPSPSARLDRLGDETHPPLPVVDHDTQHQHDRDAAC